MPPKKKAGRRLAPPGRFQQKKKTLLLLLFVTFLFAGHLDGLHLNGVALDRAGDLDVVAGMAGGLILWLQT